MVGRSQSIVYGRQPAFELFADMTDFRKIGFNPGLMRTNLTHSILYILNILPDFDKLFGYHLRQFFQ
jgi:hypothetical protein